jgi:small subunit ribosomal protein S10e
MPAIPTHTLPLSCCPQFRAAPPHTPPHPHPHPHRFLTDSGIEYLREYLALPQEIVPATLKKTARPVGERPRPAGDRPPRRFGGDREGGRFGGDREGYRSGPREGGFGRGGDKVGGSV